MADQQQMWQQALDRAAYFNVLAIPDRQQPNVTILMPGHSNNLVGVHVKGVGHRFGATVRQPRSGMGLSVSNVAGQTALNCFRFNILIPVNDAAGDLVTDLTLPAVGPVADPTHGTTYCDVRTDAEPETAKVTFPGGPPGPETGPMPFEDVENFVFTDSSGNTIGIVKAPVLAGRAILAQVEGIPPQMASQIFGGFAHIEEGTGQFAGASGIVTNVGIGTADPHLTDSVYVCIS